MKKNFTLIAAAALAFAAQAAPVVTYNGEALENGQTVKFDSKNIEEKVPGIIYAFEEHFTITGAVPMTLNATANTDKLAFCTTKNCFSFFPNMLGTGFEATAPVEQSPEDLKVDATFEGEAGMPNNVAYINFSLTDADGANFKFRLELDAKSAGVEGIAADSETVAYDIAGRRVQGELPAGLYIVNGKKVLVK